MRTAPVLLLAAASLSFSQQTPRRDRTVIVVSIDGLPAAAWRDSRLPMPFLRKLAREGVLAEGMIPVNPSVTWPNHTTMVTGVYPARHGVLFNGLPVFEGERSAVTIEPWRDKSELVQAPTVYDLAHQAGLKTAQVDWVAIHNPRTIHFPFPEVPSPDGAIEKEMIAAGILTREEVAEFMKSSPAWRDHYWTEAAIHILRKHKPNLLLFHLLQTDSLNHRHGAGSPASLAGYAYADACVKRLMDAVEQAGLAGRTTLLVVSDHGFRTAARQIRANVVLASQGLLRSDAGKVDCDVYVVPEGGTAMLYVRNARRKAELLPKLRSLFAETEGVADVIDRTGYRQLGLPDPEKTARMADLFLVAKPGYAFSGALTGPAVAPMDDRSSPGNHGYIHTDDQMQATFLAWGADVRKGARLGVIRNLDVAPTIATLLGLTMSGIEGKPLTDALDRR